jgi:hypothetical protein
VVSAFTPVNKAATPHEQDRREGGHSAVAQKTHLLTKDTALLEAARFHKLPLQPR